MIEQFEVFDDDGRSLGLVPRDRVHREGQLHKAVQVFVFNDRDELLLQLRAQSKDLYAGCWDASVGEHLIPGERFAEAAVRGVEEELGVSIAETQLNSIGEPMRLRLTGDGFVDFEEQQLYSVRLEGPFRIDEQEVEAVRFVERTSLMRWVTEEPERFTPWLKQHLAYYASSSLS